MTQRRTSLSVMLLAPRGWSYMWCRKEMKSAWLAKVTTRLLRTPSTRADSAHRVSFSAASLLRTHSRRERARVVLGHGEEVLEDVVHARAQRRRKALKDDVRVRFRHRAQLRVLDVVPRHAVHQPEVRRGPYRARERERERRERERRQIECERKRTEGEVADDQAVRLAAVLVHDDNVGVAARAAGLHQFAHDLRSAVEPRGVGKHQLELLRERRQPRGGVAAGGEQDARVLLASARVLVVHVRRQRRGAHILQRRLLPQRRFLALQLSGDGLAVCAQAHGG